MKIEKLVPDTSVIIEGLVSEKIEKKEFEPARVIIHEAIIAELEHQANSNKEIGFVGLSELKKLRKLSTERNFDIEFAGKRPGASEIRYAKLGEIDTMIRQLAYETGSVLYTADKVMAEVAETIGVDVIFEQIQAKPKKLEFEKFFDATTMSVHIRENCLVAVKKGKPGDWEFKHVTKDALSRQEVKQMAIEIVENANRLQQGFVEIDKPGSTIIQIENYRIVITRPPFSDGWEITIVRPIKKLKLDDYKLSEKLSARISMQAEGILIAGAPGMGKSTFVTALAEYYASKDKIVKTVEAPRDLQLGESITQYAISHGSPEEVRDILLLSRPDYTLFDEMRNTEDFRLFADMRLAGVGMVGIVHATNPIDAIQRFIGRIELGVIPQVIDTVVYIKNGKVDKVFELKMEVKVPSGMTEADLARPIVTVRDFETQKLEYEVYSYGEETVVIPVVDLSDDPSVKLIGRGVEREFEKYADTVKVEMKSKDRCIVYVPERDIAKIIGKKG
ncbi:PINc/VapC family ATPase, partial [Candidatus Woesearchaeota archaeon]|nr:PINc/VapC family ATPase [Candidatus Woesearchaeota archaeon]